MPFSIKVYQIRLKSETSNSGLFDPILPSLLRSSRIISLAKDAQIALLVSDCSWSIFFDAIDATDPSDILIYNLRMLVGISSVEDASKDRVVKDRVLDGPTELSFSYPDSTILKADWFLNTNSVNFFPGVSTAKRGDSLIGFRDNDTFLATQSFTWNFKGTEAKTHILSFREMLELCKDSTWLSPCICDDKVTKSGSLEVGRVFTINGSNVDRILPKASRF